MFVAAAPGVADAAAARENDVVFYDAEGVDDCGGTCGCSAPRWFNCGDHTIAVADSVEADEDKIGGEQVRRDRRSCDCVVPDWHVTRRWAV